MRVFLPGAGAQPVHVRSFKAQSQVERVIISELDREARGVFEADASYELPPFSSPDFAAAVLELSRVDPFDLCLPLHDTVLLALSDNREALSEGGFRLLLNPAETITVARDKLKVSSFFKQVGMGYVPTWTVTDFLAASKPQFPCFVRPRFIDMRAVSGRKIMMRLDYASSLPYLAELMAGQEDDYVVQPFMDGPEVNLDFFCDEQGELLSLVALERSAAGRNLSIFAGRILDKEPYLPWIEKIAKTLKFIGPNQVQCRLTEDGLVGTDLNVRFSGSTVFGRAAGVDYFKGAIELVKGATPVFREPEKLHMNSWEEPFFFGESPSRQLVAGGS
jgi:hypothetical protein